MKPTNSFLKNHSIGWEPKFEITLPTQLDNSLCLSFTNEVFLKLGWTIEFGVEECVRASYINVYQQPTEHITVTYHNCTLHVKSVTVKGMWDYGRNAKRVTAFIKTFRMLVQKYTLSELRVLQNTIEAEKKEDIGVKKIPLPTFKRTPHAAIPCIGGILLALLVGFLFALSSATFGYIPLVYEGVVVLFFPLLFMQLVKISNYTHLLNLKYMLLVGVITIYTANLFFLCYFATITSSTITLSTAFNHLLEHGIYYPHTQTGRRLLIYGWLSQLLFTYIFGALRFNMSFINYRLAAIPAEVIDFTYYQITKQPTLDDVRLQLSKMGWKQKKDQDEIFEALSIREY